jgi:hypothetical protein
MNAPLTNASLTNAPLTNAPQTNALSEPNDGIDTVRADGLHRTVPRFTGVYSVKGGQGTSTVTAALAVVSARQQPTLVIESGDVGLILGQIWGQKSNHDRLLLAPEPCRVPGQPGRPETVVANLDVVQVSNAFAGTIESELHDLARNYAHVVIDFGVIRSGLPIDRCVTSVMVVRNCFLALRHAIELVQRPDHIIAVQSTHRHLRIDDIEAVLGQKVLATIDDSPDIGASIDAGTLATAMPRTLQRALRDAAVLWQAR